ncbi:hypothetical protein [Natronincola ferrireducens]|uniref:Uncharacterized protein n=1 Tax=Natronincola ferrireducens TaxID=393762 RepID=A0A1G9GE59_9FIRM|nr:hypothetical protein [Natronincola ferrireducens]SDK98917.1 hypothetical protein SAMN05660472_02393 [Natronincola ferrireducens]
MSTGSKKVLREMITGADLRTAEDLQSYLKELFKDTLPMSKHQENNP